MTIVQGHAILIQPVLFSGSGHIFIGNNVHLGYRPSPFLYNSYIHIEARNPTSSISIGDEVWINNQCVLISEGAGIEIGSNTIMGPNVEIYDSDFHSLTPNMRTRDTQKTLKVFIGRNVFIGSNVKIMKGVTIGDNSVIGSGSIIASSIPTGTIAAGNPARVINKVL